jgi:hypothetical protein
MAVMVPAGSKNCPGIHESYYFFCSGENLFLLT